MGFCEVQPAREQEHDGADGGEARIVAGLAFGGLEKAVDSLQKAVGLAGADPGDDTLEVLADYLGHRLHRLDRGEVGLIECPINVALAHRVVVPATPGTPYPVFPTCFSK